MYTISYKDWLGNVKGHLISLGYSKDITLCQTSWRQSYDEGLTSLEAVGESELDGASATQTFQIIRKLESQKQQL